VLPKPLLSPPALLFGSELEVSPSGDPKLTGEQWHRYIDGRVAKMESTIAGQRR